MAIELKVPSAGESITEVVIVEWLKGEGAHAKRDEPLALIETDKANVEVMAPETGTVSRIMKKAGESAKVGEVIALFEPGEAKAGATPAAAPPSPEMERAKKDAQKEAQEKIVSAPAAQRAEPPSPTSVAPQTGGPVLSPPARAKSQPAAAANESTSHTVDLGRVSPSARRAMREAPVKAEAPQNGSKGSVTGSGDLAGARAITSREGASPIEVKGDPRERVVAMTPLRKRVAERLLEAQQSAALLTTFNEVDMTNVMALRKQHQDAFKERHGVKLGFMSFFVKAAVEALRVFPAINAEIRGNDIIYHDYADIGVAVGGGKGLVVPVLRGAESLSFATIERTIGDFGERAKAGRLRVEELQNGTFTISNGGVYGSLMSTPIVNPPQSGILGMHAIQERPIARAGQVVVAPMMYIALTYDHRIVDGREAVGFLVRIKECVENPTRLLLEV